MASTYPLKAPISVEISTAGTAIDTEFQKYPRSPSQRTPVQAEDQALAQASKLGSTGSASRLPARISSSGLSEVAIITNKGSR